MFVRVSRTGQGEVGGDRGEDGRRVEPERGNVPPCPAGRVSEVSRGTQTVG